MTGPLTICTPGAEQVDFVYTPEGELIEVESEAEGHGILNNYESRASRHAVRGGVRSHAARAEELGSIPNPLAAGGLSNT